MRFSSRDVQETMALQASAMMFTKLINVVIAYAKQQVPSSSSAATDSIFNCSNAKYSTTLIDNFGVCASIGPINRLDLGMALRQAGSAYKQSILLGCCTLMLDHLLSIQNFDELLLAKKLDESVGLSKIKVLVQHLSKLNNFTRHEWEDASVNAAHEGNRQNSEACHKMNVDVGKYNIGDKEISKTIIFK